MTTQTTLASEISAHLSATAGAAPAELMTPFAAEQAVLAETSAPDTALTPGSPMPDGELLDIHGEATTLDAARAGRPAVVVFYRGAWCPYCNTTLRIYERDVAPRLTERDVKLIAISPQTPDGSLTMQEKHELSYAVLSDPGNQIAGRLGILTTPSEDARASQLKLGLDLTAVNADGTTTLPMPTVVLVDADGQIRWIDIHPNYATRTEPAEILAAVTEALGDN